MATICDASPLMDAERVPCRDVSCGMAKAFVKGVVRMLKLLLWPFKLIVWPFKAVGSLMFGIGKGQAKKASRDLRLP